DGVLCGVRDRPMNLGCIDFNPWAIRAADVDHPDELRVDLDPQPDSSWDDVRNTATCNGGKKNAKRACSWTTTRTRATAPSPRPTPFDPVQTAASPAP